MNETFMKEKPVLPLLVSMALPNVISMLVNSLYNIVDSLFVARISEDAMTALSLVFPIQNFVRVEIIPDLNRFLFQLHCPHHSSSSRYTSPSSVFQRKVSPSNVI